MPSSVRLHASAVAFEGRGVLILGASGSGKSSLAMHLMKMGATLVADDQTDLAVQNGDVFMHAPDSIAGLIEVRGVGLLNAEASAAPLHLIIDLDTVETKRLPDPHDKTILGKTFPCLHKVDNSVWPFAIIQYLTGGRRNPE